MQDQILFENKVVLLVEDDLAVAETVSQQLSILGFSTVLIATTLSQAHAILDRDSIDTAVLDVNLLGGEMTIELGRSLAANGTPIVFFSGFNADEMAQLTQGHEFMEKPISIPRLKAALHRATLRIPAQSFQRRKKAGQMARQ